MSISRLACSAILLSCLSATFPQASYAQTATPTATAGNAPVVNERSYSLEYKEGLLSVREEGAKYLFAQAVTTPTVQVRVEAARGKSVKLTIQDEKGKQLWSSPLIAIYTTDKTYSGLMLKTSQKGGIQFTLSPGDAADKPTAGKTSGKLTMIAKLRADNVFLVADVDAGEDTAHFQRLDDGTGMTFTSFKNGKQEHTSTFHFGDENKPFSATVNGQEVASAQFGGNDFTQPTTLSDATGKIAIRTIKQDSKEYIELQIGERRLLIEGVNYQMQLKDGVITLISTPVAPTTSAPAARTP